jgi:hypothetical protein
MMSITTIAMQLLGKYVSTIQTVFSAWSVLRRDNRRRYKELRYQLWGINQRTTEAEESPLLRLVPGNV